LFDSGLTLFRRYLDDAAQQALAGEIAVAVLQAPWFLPRMPRSGRAFSVKMTHCGSLGWASDQDGGYRYQPTHPVTGRAWAPIPSSVLDIWRPWPLTRICRRPVSSISTIATRAWAHTKTAPRQNLPRRSSRSLGDTCCFRYGGLRRDDAANKLERRSGDVIVLGGPARLIFHGVDKIHAGSSGLLPGGGRINLTLRRVTSP
jgi:DNA oxidative demethylase